MSDNFEKNSSPGVQLKDFEQHQYNFTALNLCVISLLTCVSWTNANENTWKRVLAMSKQLYYEWLSFYLFPNSFPNFSKLSLDLVYTTPVNSLLWEAPSRYLLVQSPQWQYQNNVWNLFKVNNKDTRMTSLRSF